MTIEQIREKLAIEIAHHALWLDQLNDTEPGNYGVEDWDVYLESKDIWVDIPSKTFNFKNAKFDFEVMLGASNPEDGMKHSHSTDATGKGKFIFSNNSNDIKIEEIEIECESLDLMA